MMSKKAIEQRVLGFYRGIDPNCTRETQFKRDLGLSVYKIEQYNTDLAIELGCNPKRSQLVACKSIGALIELLIKTRISTRGILYAAAQP
jgi:hypothetical protein